MSNNRKLTAKSKVWPDGNISVWSEEPGYKGPVARITADDTWLYICTDDYEGNAMMNIETLPELIKALKKIARSQKIEETR